MIRWIKKRFLSDKKIQRLLWAALVLAVMISGWNALILAAREMSVFVRVSMKSPESGQAALYYDVGLGFNSRHVSTSPVHGDGKFHDVKLKIPFLKIFHHLRFDPPSISEGEIIANKVDIVDRDGRILYDFGLNSLKPLYQIKTIDFIDGHIRFTMDETANDPQIRILVDSPILLNRLQLLTRMMLQKVIPEFFVLFFVLFFVCVLLIYVWSRLTDPVIATLVVLAIVISGWRLYDDSNSVYFRLSMKAAVQGETAELFYDQGYGLSGGDFVLVHIQGDDLFHDYTFKIPRNVRYLRFDPLTWAGTVLINKMEITDRSGKVLKSFKLHKMSPELSPAQQIKAFEFLDEGLKIITEDKANDPQISIMLDEASIQQIHARHFPPMKKTLMEWSLTFVLLIAVIVIWKRYKERICRFIDGGFFQEKLPVLYLGCALGVILAMAFISGLDVHPDELGHANSTGYYSNSWLPPSVDDPNVLKTISGFGVSYLFRLEMVYLLSAKFALLLSGLVNDNYLRLRLFNVMLFLILVLIVARKTRSVPLFILALVLSPQVWYIFSYFNGDGFAFFIALLIALQLIDSDSLIYQYLNSTTMWGKWSGGVLFGILVGSLLFSKMNYYLYIVFILVIIAWNFISERRFAQWGKNSLRIKKWALVAFVALSVYLPPVFYDQYINDFNKDEKIGNFVEKNADYMFKPSTIRNAPDDSYPGLYLRLKGVSLHEIFLENSYWRELSFSSFFGLYGYMNIYADSHYYEILSMFLFGMILFIYFYAACTINLKEGIVLCMVFIFLLLAIGQSVYASWAGDFEPQGRYIFPMIPIALVGLSRLPVFFKERVVPCFNLILFIFSMTSFVLYALLYIPKI
ncbi:MAG: DUF2142 domain-containing protein [Desulfobacterales bacterium]